MSHTLEAEIERNYGAFLDLLPDLVRTDAGRFALMHNGELQGLFDLPGEAAREGFAKFGPSAYSIQLVTDEPVDQGFMTSALR